MSKCNQPLTILPEFERFCCPVYVNRNADGPMGELSIRPEKAEERRTIRRQLLKEHLEETKTVAPFLVWRRRKNLVIVDGRHEEFRVASEMKLPIQTVEFKFKNMEEAREKGDLSFTEISDIPDNTGDFRGHF